MSTIQSKGPEFVQSERERLDKLLSGSISPSKADEFTKRKIF